MPKGCSMDVQYVARGCPGDGRLLHDIARVCLWDALGKPISCPKGAEMSPKGFSGVHF